MTRWMAGAVTALVLVFGAVSGFSQQEIGHYANGEEGIKGASMPGPGIYGRLYLDYYVANALKDADGNVQDIGFNLDLQVAAPCFVWFPPVKILGADYGMYMVVPIVRQEITIEDFGVQATGRGLGDICLNPVLLSWHGAKGDVTAGLGTYIPTGDFDPAKTANPGFGYSTYMLTLGGTYFPEGQRVISMSALGRYEVNSKKDGIDIQPGDRFQFDWGIGANLSRVWEVGMAGFCSWQVTDDTGDDVTWDASVHDRIFGIGPEISFFAFPSKLNTSLRYAQEFGARDRPEGHSTWLTLTQIF